MAFCSHPIQEKKIMTPLGIESATVPRHHRKHAPSQTGMGVIVRQALTGAFTKLDPRLMVKNPVMLVVEVGFLLTIAMSFNPTLFGPTGVTQAYIFWVAL